VPSVVESGADEKCRPRRREVAHIVQRGHVWEADLPSVPRDEIPVDESIRRIGAQQHPVPIDGHISEPEPRGEAARGIPHADR
jgi:hypothetical protein